MTELSAVVWRYCVAFWLSPLDVSRLRGVSRWFRQVISDTASCYRQKSVRAIIMHAARHGHMDVVKMMISTRGCVASAIACSVACREGHVQLMEMLTELIGHNPSLWDAMLPWAAERGHREIVERLVVNGATNNLHYACDMAAWNGHREIEQLLREIIKKNEHL